MKYKIKTQNNKRYIVIPQLEELGLKHCFTTIDMNINLEDKKSTTQTKENLEYVFKFLNIAPPQLFYTIQTHSKDIITVKDLNQGKKAPLGRYFSDKDGLTTNLNNVALLTTFADCTPILLYDPIKKVHTNIHSGWRGTLQRIGANGVDIMVRDYSCNPKDIIAIIGPSIGKQDFEVELDVKTLFANEFAFHSEVITQKNDIKYLIDLQTISRRVLLQKGLTKDNITTINLSTKSTPMLHSFRRDQDNFGLMALVSMLDNFI